MGEISQKKPFFFFGSSPKHIRVKLKLFQIPSPVPCLTVSRSDLNSLSSTLDLKLPLLLRERERSRSSGNLSLRFLGSSSEDPELDLLVGGLLLLLPLEPEPDRVLLDEPARSPCRNTIKQTLNSKRNALRSHLILKTLRKSFSC